MARPWLSVILPVYNGARHLGAALESVVVQRRADIEVIAVDDGSDDDSARVMRQFESRLDLKIVSQTHTGNWTLGTNLAMARAEGHYLCWLHQDDVWRPGRLDRLRGIAARRPDASLIVHPCWYIDDSGRRIGYWHCPLPRSQQPLAPAAVLERLLVQCLFASPAPLFRADAAARVGRLDPDLWYSADWDFWLKLASSGTTIYDPTPLASFRLHARSQTMSRVADSDEYRRQQETVLRRHLVIWDQLCPGRDDIRRVAEFSVRTNVALARWAAGESADWVSLARGFARLGTAGGLRYLRDSRIVERCLSRAQARVLPARRRRSVNPATTGSPSRT